MGLNFVHVDIYELQRFRNRKEQDLRELIERKMNLVQEMADIDKEMVLLKSEILGLTVKIQNPQVSEGYETKQGEAEKEADPIVLEPTFETKSFGREWDGEIPF